MPQRSTHARTVLGCALALLAPAAPAFAGIGPLAPPGEGFRIAFPLNPTAQDSSSAAGTVRQWNARDGGFAFLVTHVASRDPKAKPLGPDGLAADLTAFLNATGATLIDKKSMPWPEPGGHHQALKFAFRMPKGDLGMGVFVLAGIGEYSAEVVNFNSSDEAKAMDAFVTSLEILD
jgi:hypothetical protein